MFRVKNKLFILLHVSLAFLFFGCDVSNKNQAYISDSSHKEVLIFPKETKEIQKEEKKKSNPLFINETLVNKAKLQKRERNNQDILSKWWLFAIAVSIFIIIYFIRLLMRKQKIILETLKEHSS